MHVIQKQYGIFITINHCSFELKAAQKKNKLQNNYKNDRSRINFIPPHDWKCHPDFIKFAHFSWF